MKAIFYAVIMALASVEAMAQSITGKVVDESNLPMEFVNVVLQKADSTYITGTVTDFCRLRRPDHRHSGYRQHGRDNHEGKGCDAG